MTAKSRDEGTGVPAQTSTTSWRDEPVVPDNYADPDALLRVAREARGRIVEFDWGFTGEDLRRLRRAVYEWGSTTAGRYKCFDARVLVAISDVLGEADGYALNEPTKIGGIDCEVSCIDDGHSFRLRGHAPFDIVFGYGSSGLDQDPVTNAQLGPTVGKTLGDSIDMLGWDLPRLLQSPILRSVKNVLYGLPIDYGLQEMKPAAGPAIDVPVHFHGPFSALDGGEHRCLFTDEVAAHVGVYLWTINVGGQERLWYVGQTRRGFAVRMAEHVAGFLSGEYVMYDAAALSRGENRLAAGAISGYWPQTLPSFLANYERLTPNIIDLIRMINFHVAPLDNDALLLNQVEGAIGRHYMAHSEQNLRDFLTLGLRVPREAASANPVRLVLTSEAPIAGLPKHLLAGPRVMVQPVSIPFPEDVCKFVDSTRWTFAKTYAATWPHEYVVRTPENALMVLALARHIFEHGVEERFYSQIRKYHHEGGKVYWSMDPTPEETTLINRCDETHTYEARLAAGTLPNE